MHDLAREVFLGHPVRITLPMKYFTVLYKDNIMRSTISCLYRGKNMSTGGLKKVPPFD